MSPSRSRSTAVTAFIGSKGNADSKTKTKSNKAKGAKGRKGAEESKACAPFKPVNEAPAVVAVAPRQEAVAQSGVQEQTQTKAEKEQKHIIAGDKNRESKENVTVEESSVKEKEKETVDLGLSARDVRAYEHERQRVKRAEERAVRRAKKEREVQGRVGAAGAGVGRGGRGRETEVDGEYVVGGVVAKKTRTQGGVVLGRGEEDAGGGEKGAARIGKDEVLLSDLVVYSSQRTRSRGGGEEEFEFVPAVRAVIVLDDGEFGCGYGENGGRDMDVDDTWECVDGEKEEGLSYAQVVLGLHID